MSDCCSVNPGASSTPSVMTCPECGSRSKKVEALTVRSLVRHLLFNMPPAQYYFCESPGCDLVYFPSDGAAPRFHRGDLLVRVGVKEKADPIPICYCFGVSRKDLWEEVERTGKSTLAEKIRAEVKAGNCACESKNPSGKCCLGNVTRAVQEGLGIVQEPPARE